MTSSPTQGFQGGFKVSTTAMVQVKTCKIQTKFGTFDVTAMTGLSTPAWKSFLSGLGEWTLTVTGNYDQLNDAVQSTLWGALGGAAQAISFSPNTGTNKFSGNAIVTDFSPDFDVSKEEAISITLQGTGALAFA